MQLDILLRVVVSITIPTLTRRVITKIINRKETKIAVLSQQIKKYQQAKRGKSVSIK